MQRTTAIFAAICMSLTIVGCSKDKTTAGPDLPKVEQPDLSPAWKISYQAVCNSGAAADCLGKDAITVSADGSYVVGADLIHGIVTPVELENLKKALAPALSGTGHDELVAPQEESDEEVSITFTQKSQSEQKLIATSGTEFKFRLSSKEQADALQAEMKKLANHYYPTGPLEGKDCNGAIEALHKLQAPLRSCEMDSQCAYISDQYAPIDRGTDEFVTTDDGLNYNLLIVANASATSAAQADLQIAREAVYGACTLRYDYNGIPGGFQSASHSPSCVKNVCQAAPENAY